MLDTVFFITNNFIYRDFNPLTLRRTQVSPFTEISILQRNAPILGYVPKNVEKKRIWSSKG